MLSEKEIKAKIDFLSSSRCNHTFHKYIDITGDLIEGTLLSRILYWFMPTKDNKSKVRICKDGYYWIAKQRKDWWEEIRITERQYDKAIKSLVDKGLVITAKYKFNSMPTIHIRPNYEVINDKLKEWEDGIRQEIIEEDSELHNQQIGNYTKCKTGVTGSVNLLTGITNNDYNTENTFYAFTESYDSEKGTLCSLTSVSEDAREEEKRYKIEDVPYLIKKYADKNIRETRLKNLSDIIVYFIDVYAKNSNTEHMSVSETAIKNIIDAYINATGKVKDADVWEYEEIINDYFKTNYKMDGRPIVKSLQHFFSGKIRENIYMKRI